MGSQQETHHTSRATGIAMAIGASGLWGLSGNVAQSLFENYAFRVAWLVTVRLVGAGILCLLLARFGPERRDITAVWRDKGDRLRLATYGVIGMIGVQYTFFSSIQAGNAAAATLLQYACPIFLVGYGVARYRRLPTAREAVAVCLAVPGIALLVTNGRFDRLSVPPAAVVWGLLSAVAAAFYISYPPLLIRRWGAATVTGWAMLIGGIIMTFINRPWITDGQHWTPMSVLAVCFVVFFGTFVAFYLYLDSLRTISPTEASLLGSAEPLTAAIVSVLWLKVSLGLWQVIGGLLVLGTMAVLSTAKTAGTGGRISLAQRLLCGRGKRCRPAEYVDDEVRAPRMED